MIAQLDTLTNQHSGTCIPGNDKLRLVDERIKFYSDQMVRHPLARLLRAGAVPLTVLHECATIQFRSSVLWVPLLAVLKDRARNEPLKRALLDNLLCESGAHGTSHVELCSRFLKSIEARPAPLTGFASLPDANLEDLVFVAELAEPEVTGWLLSAEVLTPIADAMLVEGFKHVPNVDLEFLHEHIVIDSDEHAAWMREAAGELLRDSECIDEILFGVDLGARAEFKLLDSIYAKTLHDLKRRNIT